MEYLPEKLWREHVESFAIPSVDLIIRTEEGILLGKRNNRPAKGYWFVPGSMVRKGERLEEAVHRTAEEELSAEANIVSQLGTYDHIYPDSDIGENISKHYVATGFVVKLENSKLDPDSQHSEIASFEKIPRKTHENTLRYLRDAMRENLIKNIELP